ncbi:class I SAM-dependent methyltransferase [Streptomyces beihaiensis]|uniref:S-adenosyl-L-methionine-dependent methyltransferase n=1 Tax=Streptomyces beihaiensis TaxID=2984495 RepID=A0ABT3TTM3_9ACTN|nr:class I SAM-dependent methyltransferase [Streptomyces beihaiensis]MCX3060393.1 class I SAM-dependent methyltransferase [Streptomyces beihaiensis]
MSENENPSGNQGGRAASRTAVLVCQGRAVADGRPAAGRFTDPVAARLLSDAERTPVDEVRAGTPPRGWRARGAYESVRACAEIVVPRTVAIDDALRGHASGQLVILGAGLDTRAWRLPGLAATDVWEVDHPASQRDKRARLAELGDLPVTARSVRFTPVDFAVDDLGAALDAAGHDPSVPTTWLWEGVVPYLTRAQVRGTLAALAARTAPGSALVVNYQAPRAKAAAGRLLARALRFSATANEPWRSLWRPRRMAALLAEHGLPVVSDESLLDVAHDLGTPRKARGSLRSGRVAVAERP